MLLPIEGDRCPQANVLIGLFPMWRFRCGYTVSKVTYDSIALVHETSVLHYKDDLTFTFTEEVAPYGEPNIL